MQKLLQYAEKINKVRKQYYIVQ